MLALGRFKVGLKDLSLVEIIFCQSSFFDTVLGSFQKNIPLFHQICLFFGLKLTNQVILFLMRVYTILYLKNCRSYDLKIAYKI